MASGFFLGGLAQGFSQQSQAQSLEQYRLKELQLQQQAQQQAAQRDQNANYMKIRSDAVAHLDDTITQLKIAHPDWGPMQLASNPAVVAMKNQIGQLDQNLKLPNTIDSIVASLAEKPSQAVTERALSEARDPYKGALEASEIEKNKAATANLKTDADMMKDLTTPTGDSGGNKTLDFFAEQLLDGNQQVLSGFSRSKGGVAMRMQIQKRAAEMAIERGLSPTDVNANVAEFMGEKAGASALGRREAQVTGAATTAMQTAPRVLAASAAVDRTKYPSLNSALMAWRQGTGDENVVRLGIAVNTFVNNYARALGAGNASVTDSARREAFENLNKAWSQGQIGAAVDQMLNKELPSEITGAKMGIKQFLQQQNKKPAAGAPQYKFNANTGELEPQ